jgi:hypothetical protein
LQSALNDIRTAIATATGAASVPATPNAGPANPAATQPAAELSVRQIAASDPVMSAYLKDLDRLEADLQRLRSKYSDAHPNVVSARASIATTRERVEKYAQTYRQFHAAAKNANDPKSPPVTGKSLEDLRANEQAVANLLGKAIDEMVALGDKQSEFQRKKQELQALREELEQVAGACSAVGYLLRRPACQSLGLLNAAGSDPEFVDYMQSPRTVMTSPRVVQMAIRDPIWKAAGRQPPADPNRYLATHLQFKRSERAAPMPP